MTSSTTPVMMYPEVVVVILSGAIVGVNDDSPALSLDRASLDADLTKSTSSCCDVVVFAVVVVADMDGVGGNKFTFLINSRLSEPLFTITESTTALCAGSG